MDDKLTDSEKRIIELMDKGYSSEKEIAEILRISVHTVKSCIISAKIKLGQS
ncbi:hypothetical protein IKP85_05915 [bacterium]|nr:hypothetical protein [bacterium]